MCLSCDTERGVTSSSAAAGVTSVLSCDTERGVTLSSAAAGATSVLTVKVRQW